ncbi:hypothetical protein OAS86_06985 [Gammaproteobacteria bacterium]|nr:hypothetical protein [Gammaproteobacteria bacterium]
MCFKTVRVHIEKNINPSVNIERLETEIASGGKLSMEDSLIFQQVKGSIVDFHEKITFLGIEGSTLHFQKEFILSSSKVIIHADYPPKYGLVYKIKKYLGI